MFNRRTLRGSPLCGCGTESRLPECKDEMNHFGGQGGHRASILQPLGLGVSSRGTGMESDCRQVLTVESTDFLAEIRCGVWRK